MRYSRFGALILVSMLSLCSVNAYAQSHYATKQAQESYDTGIKLERQADERNDKSYLVQAEKQYRDAINAEPNMVQSYVRMGYVLYALDRSEEGVKLLEEALKRHPDSVELKHYLGLNLYQTGKTDEAEKLLQDVIQTKTDLPEAYFVLGKISLDKGDSLNAKTYFQQYAALTPNDVHAYRALSSAYIQAKDIAGAESALARLLELAPDDVIAKINMGHVKYERGQVDEAVKLYEQAYKADERRDELLYTIASAYYLSGRYEEAIKRFEVVLEKDKDHMAAQYFTADSRMKLGQLDEADKLFQALEEKMPDYKYIKLKRAYIRMLRGESGAENDVRKLMKETDNPDDLHFGAVMLRKRGMIDESINTHALLRDNHPGENIYGVYLAREYLEARNYTEASNILTQIIDESVGDSLAWEMLSMTYLNQGVDAMMMGEFDQARSFFDQALSMDVHVTSAHCSFAQLALLEGRTDDAFQSYQFAEQISADDPVVVRLAAQFDMMDGEYKYAVQRLKELESAQSSDALGGSGWYLMAVAQSKLGAWDEADKALIEAAKYGVVDSPATATVALQKAIKAYRENKVEEGDRQLSRVKDHKDGLDQSDKVRYDYLTAVASIRAKKFAAARSALESVNSEFNELPADVRGQIVQGGKLDVSFELAYVYYESGNYEAALSLLNGRSGSDAKSLEAAVRRKLGFQTLRSKKYDSALENYNRLNSLGNMNNADQYNYVLAKMQAHKLNDASAQLEKFAKQNIPEAVLNYAIYLDGAGEAAKATQYYEKYVSMTSSRKSEDVRRMLATKQRVWGGSGLND